jgi:hypothetical protein
LRSKLLKSRAICSPLIDLLSTHRKWARQNARTSKHRAEGTAHCGPRRFSRPPSLVLYITHFSDKSWQPPMHQARLIETTYQIPSLFHYREAKEYGLLPYSEANRGGPHFCGADPAWPYVSARKVNWPRPHSRHFWTRPRVVGYRVALLADASKPGWQHPRRSNHKWRRKPFVARRTALFCLLSGLPALMNSGIWCFVPACHFIVTAP